MSLIDQLFVGGGWVDSAARFTNNTGTMLASASALNDGEAIADDYLLTASAVGGGTATITVTTLASKNPYRSRTGRPAVVVNIDGVTVYGNVVPGVALVFNNTTANGHTSHVIVGAYAGSFDAFGIGAGTPSAAVRHRVFNNGTDAVEDAKAQLKTQAVLYKKIGAGVFAYVDQKADGATEKTATLPSTQTLPYHITVANVTGAGSSKVADLQVDGVTLGAASVRDLTTGAAVSGAGLKAITPNYLYLIITGPLTGLTFALSAAVANTDTANIIIFPSRYVQIAADDGAGNPVTFGTTDITLTQAGQSAGIIQASGEAFYHTRVVVPAGSGAESNPHPTDVFITATQTGAASYDG